MKVYIVLAMLIDYEEVNDEFRCIQGAAIDGVYSSREGAIRHIMSLYGEYHREAIEEYKQYEVNPDPFGHDYVYLYYEEHEVDPLEPEHGDEYEYYSELD